MPPRRPLRERLPGGQFARHVAVLAGGTAIGQALTLAASPIVTRLYSPTDYGGLAVYGSILTVLLVAASLRYDQAIPLPEDDDAGGGLLLLSLALVGAMTLLVALAVWLLGDALVTWAQAPRLRPYLWLLPAGYLGAGCYQALNYWAVRRKAFPRIARTKLTQSVGLVTTQLGLGALGIGQPGLLVADVVSRVSGAGSLALIAYRDRVRWGAARRLIMAAGRRYYKFPAVTLWGSLLNSASFQLPPLLLSASFNAQVAGLYSLGFRILGAPVQLIGQAVSQVFFSHAAGMAREPERLRALTERATFALFACGVPVFGVVIAGGPRLFEAVFGARWSGAGAYAQLLAPWFMFWLVSNPLSSLAWVREWQGSALLFTIAEFALRIGSIAIGAREGSPTMAIALLSASGVLISAAAIVRFLHAGYSGVRHVAAPIGRVALLGGACLAPAAVAFARGPVWVAFALTASGVAAYLAVLSRFAAVRELLRTPAPTPPADAPLAGAPLAGAPAMTGHP